MATLNEPLWDLIDAAEARGYRVIAVDMRAFAVTLEEPLASGVTLRLTGRLLTPDYIRTLPEARMPDEHRPVLPPSAFAGEPVIAPGGERMP